MSQLQTNLTQIEKRISGFGRFRRRWKVLDGLGRFVVFAPGAVLVWLAIDGLLKLPPWPLFVLFFAVCVWGLVSAVRWLVRPQISSVDTDKEAVFVEELHGSLDNQVIGSMQLGREVIAAESSDGQIGYSTNLVDALVQRSADRLKDINIHRLLDLSEAKKILGAAFGVVLVFVVLFAAAPDFLKNRLERLRYAYATVMDDLFPVTMVVTPGDKPVVRGTELTLAVKVMGARRNEVLLHQQDHITGETETTPLTLEDELAEFKIAETLSDFTYFFEYGGRNSSIHEIRVDDLPQVKAINYEITPPAYTSQPMRLMTGRVSKLQGLSGTSIFVSFAANTRLHPEMCYVEWLNGEKQGIDISGRFGSFAFNILKKERLSIHLTGHFGEGFEMKQPLNIDINMLRDTPPSVQMLVKRTSDEAVMGAGAGAALRLPWLAKDDFGVKEVTVHYQVEAINELLGRGKRTGSSQIKVDPPRERAKGRFQNIFRGISPRLAPGDRIKLWLTAKDNNTVTGPGMGKSEPLQILLVGAGFGMFVQNEFDLKSRRESALLLRGLKQVKRSTDLLQAPTRTVRTEAPIKLKKHIVDARPGKKTMLGESEDDVGRYFDLLSGGGTR